MQSSHSIPAPVSSMSTLEPIISSQNPKSKQGKQRPAKLFDGFNPVIKSTINSQSSTVDLNKYPSCLESSNEEVNSVCINTELSLQPYSNVLDPSSVGAPTGRHPGIEPCRRRPVQIRPIQKLSRRQVTFSKRKSSLLRKAQQLSVLCNAEVGLIIISASGKAYHYSSSKLDNMLEKYVRFSQRVKARTPKKTPPLNNKNNQLKDMERNTNDIVDILHKDIKSLEKVESQLEESMLLLKQKKMELLMKGVTQFGSKQRTSYL